MGKIEDILNDNETDADISQFLNSLAELLGSSQDNDSNNNTSNELDKISFCSCLLYYLRRIFNMLNQ